ncbi:putative fluoride ion transporter CrcB 1 [Alicyclobacillus contaminans]|uniref:fluoride efflux transporter CrcB n=1 Tax=Alicyclobacillus contaminans TaxID=392016 RepID=UPI000417EBCF|nr:fluoride efflux transporter CrcB [Alicyclobacillus contaminans]GMA52105.1 putative fluoride ion transporter CrcB 1 [Alicyclobacillus contaminans]
MSYVAVALGGFLGACARYWLTEQLGTVHGFPVATLLINLAGSFVLAWFYTFTLERMPIHPHVRIGFGTGFIGAFTTFSTLNVELWSLWRNGLWLAFAAYLVASYLGGLACAGLGYGLAMRQSRLRTVPDGKDVTS